MGDAGEGRAGPFAGRVFRYRAVPGAAEKPPELLRAETLDKILREYPGYTLRTLQDEDAYELLQMVNILDPDVGKAT